MDTAQVSSEKLRADTGSLASKETEQIPHPSENTENNSTDQVTEHSQEQINETHENEENEENEEEKNKKRDEEEEEKKKQRDKEEEKKKRDEYLPLYLAALNGDWESARRILENDPHAFTAKITLNNETVLHVAVSTGHDIQFVEKLLDYMPAESVPLTDEIGDTALSMAAKVGNIEAAKLLVKKKPDLTQIRNNLKFTPIHHAAIRGHKETICYLLSVTTDKEPSPFTEESGLVLLDHLIIAGFYGIPVEMDNVPLILIEGGDLENQSTQKCSTKSTHHKFLQQISPTFGTLCGKVHVMLWITIRKLIPSINRIHDTKLMHKQTHELVKRMCAEVMTSSGANAMNLLKMPFFTATRLGILEFVTEIIKTYPHSIWFADTDGCDVFQLAVLHRQEKIFSLLYQLGSHKYFVAEFMDESRNNLLHSAGTLKPSTRVSGAALQMQREWQWFKEVENVVKPSFKEMQNTDKKTPKMVFTEEHEKLVKQGEKWMKATASSCTLVASLVATVVFAAAFTVPGGNDSNQGIPIFLHELSFMVFAISDAISLFSSSTSLLMFLGILTSRYSEEDFFVSLPRKLIIGLITLFISIATMVIAFSAALYMVLVHRLKRWVVIPIAILACLPVSLFPLLQFPLLVELVLSTYGPSIFRQQSKNIIFANVSPPTLE